ncbi:MAG: GNAT family N-acetyltransferase [Patescibacteria group bacterium]
MHIEFCQLHGSIRRGRGFGDAYSWVEEDMGRLLTELKQAGTDEVVPPVTITSGEIRRKIDAGTVVILACDADNGDRVVGMASLIPLWKLSGDKGTIEDVVVDKECRGYGIARKLMEILHRHAKRLRLTALELTSNPKRVEANKLYQSMGYVLRETNMYLLKL